MGGNLDVDYQLPFPNLAPEEFPTNDNGTLKDQLKKDVTIGRLC